MPPTRLRSHLPLLCLLLALAVAPGCGRASEPTLEVVVEAPSEVTPEGEAPAAAPAWNADTPVGKIVAEAPATVRIFELMKIDYCCGGDRSLAVAAAEKNVDVDALLGALSVARAGPADTAEVRWNTKPLPELLAHIEATHHVFLRRELPRLAKIVATVHRVHGESHPELAEVENTFGALHEELIPHLKHEETVVFPAVLQLVAGTREPVLETSLLQMRGEHDGAGAAIHKLRDLLKGYLPPEDACTLYKEMLAGLLALEKDILMHVHLENNVLLPRCLAAR